MILDNPAKLPAEFDVAVIFGYILETERIVVDDIFGQVVQLQPFYLGMLTRFAILWLPSPGKSFKPNIYTDITD